VIVCDEEEGGNDEDEDQLGDLTLTLTLIGGNDEDEDELGVRTEVDEEGRPIHTTLTLTLIVGRCEGRPLYLP